MSPCHTSLPGLVIMATCEHKRSTVSSTCVVRKTVRPCAVILCSHCLMEATPVQLWVPAVLEPNNHHIAFRQVIGRLAAGATVTRAEAELDAANARVEAEESDRHGETEMAIAPLRDSVVGNARPALLVFLGAVGCVLLIACVNVANLLLARASARK